MELRLFEYRRGGRRAGAHGGGALPRLRRPRGRTCEDLTGLIATFCSSLHALLHRDREFDPFESARRKWPSLTQAANQATAGNSKFSPHA